MKGNVKQTLAFSFVLASLLGQSLGASEEAKSKADSVLRLDNVVVTATKTPLKVEEVPASVAVIEAEDLENKANSKNLYEALMDITGVSAVSSNSMGWNEMRIRGYAPSMLLNGRDMRHFATTYTFDTNLIDMGAVERIEVLKGPQSTMHGAHAVSGAVNVIMKKGDKNRPFVDIHTAYGSGNTLQGGITAGGGAKNFHIS